MSDGPSILIVRFGSLGDVILTTPLLRAIASAHPNAAITFVTKAVYAPVLQHHPAVHRVIAYDERMPLRSLAAALATEEWAYRLDLHGSLRSRALRWLAGGQWTTCRTRRLSRALLLRLRIGPLAGPVPVAERFFDAARPLRVVPDGQPAQVFTSPADEAGARAIAGGEYVALAPGAAHATKRWPAPHWRALARALADEGHAVVGVGLARERQLLAGAPVIDGFGAGLGVTAALLAGARSVVANDSGLMHLATAVNTPVVALFGPTVGAFGYLPYRARATIVERELGCRPCSAYGGARCPRGHHRCMTDIDPARVHAAVSAA